MPTERLPFIAENLPQLDEMLREGMAEIEANLLDNSYPLLGPRELILRIRVERPKRDPDEIETAVFKEVKVPKRQGKAIKTVLRQKRILVEKTEEDQPLFPEKVARIGGGE